jgi:hypothetical protein
METSKESFEEFKNSFNHGTRSDLNFKFLKNLSDKKAGQFFKNFCGRWGMCSMTEIFRMLWITSTKHR